VPLDFKHLVDKLKTVLSQQLPGSKAHEELIPKGRKLLSPKSAKNQEIKLGSVAIILYIKHDDVHFILIERTKYDGVHSGQIALPGGKTDPEDKDNFDTAIRETAEEIGIQLKHENVLGSLTPLFIPPSNFLVSPIVFYLEEIPFFIQNKKEVAKIIEYPLTKFLHEKIYEGEFYSSSNNQSTLAPYFSIDENKMWGATAMILNELRWIIRELK
jgi:8-oxo-dGTP pyrophosphatase MutT (NUDIX family)